MSASELDGGVGPERVKPSDIKRMIDRLQLTTGDTKTKLSAYWVLIFLSGIIASAGVIADSTATVIGAMIVAPLMTPILGTALSVVLANRRQMITNALLVLGGAALVIAIGFVIGLTSQVDIVASANSQVAGRVAPRLIDLLAALATGVVGAFATVRADISDTLPGVAIAISLVPPLAVVGLMLQSGSPSDALGALLLFSTNVSAIIATGTLVFLAYGVRGAAKKAGQHVGVLRRGTLIVVIGIVALMTVPLGVGSAVVVQQELLVNKAQPVADAWAKKHGWQVSDVEYTQGMLTIVVLGPPPTITETGLRKQLDDAGLEKVDVQVSLVYGGSTVLEGDG